MKRAMKGSFNSPAISKQIMGDNVVYRTDNAFRISIVYNFAGGRSVRKYDYSTFERE